MRRGIREMSFISRLHCLDTIPCLNFIFNGATFDPTKVEQRKDDGRKGRISNASGFNSLKEVAGGSTLRGRESSD